MCLVLSSANGKRQDYILNLVSSSTVCQLLRILSPQSWIFFQWPSFSILVGHHGARSNLRGRLCRATCTIRAGACAGWEASCAGQPPVRPPAREVLDQDKEWQRLKLLQWLFGDGNGQMRVLYCGQNHFRSGSSGEPAEFRHAGIMPPVWTEEDTTTCHPL